MEKPGIYTVGITLPVIAPFDFECMRFEYGLWARNDREYSEEVEILKRKMSVIGATVTCISRNLELLRKNEQGVKND